MKLMRAGNLFLILLPLLLFRTVLAFEISCAKLLASDDPNQARRTMVAEFRENPVYQRNRYPLIEAEVVQSLDTVRYYIKPERAVQEPKIQVLLIHGFGSDYSIGMSLATIARMLAEKPTGSKSASAKNLRMDPNYLPMHAEAIDLPGVGGGPAIERLDSLGGIVGWLSAYIQDMKRRLPGVPVYVLARSGSPLLVAEAAKRDPSLIKGIIAMSAMRPGDMEAYHASYQALVAESETRGFVLNRPVLDRFAKLAQQVRWSDDYFNDIRTLFLTGSADPQVSASERAFYSDLAANSPNIVYHEVENAGHNPLDTASNAPAGKHAGENAFRLLFRFIKDIEDGRSPNASIGAPHR